MSEHTPGPWKISGSQPGFSIHAREPVVWEMGGIIRIEDARLIAAAPALLAACEATEEWLADVGDHSEDDLSDEAKAILATIRAAINAARGAS